MAILGNLRSRLRREGTTEIKVNFPPGAANAPQQAEQFVLGINELALASGGRITEVPNSFDKPIRVNFPTAESAQDFQREAARIG